MKKKPSIEGIGEEMIKEPGDDRYKEQVEKDFGPRNDTGWDVIDKENSYNNPGFEDSKMENYAFKELAEEVEVEPEQEELMKKYGFEEDWELADYAKKCADYVEGLSDYKPLKSDAEVEELASFHNHRLMMEEVDPNGWPLSAEERARLNDKDLDELDQAFNIMNEFYTKEANLSAGDETKRDAFTDSRSYRQRGVDKSILYDNLNESLDFNTQVGQAQREIERIMKKAKTKEQTQVVKEETRPEYSSSELKFMERCFNYLVDQKGKSKRPSFDNKDPLEDEQILEAAQEFAQVNKIPRARFLENNFKGRRQLSYTERLPDGKSVKYIVFNEKMPSGDYYFQPQAGLSNFWISKDNNKKAFAKARLLFKTKSRFNQKNRQARVA